MARIMIGLTALLVGAALVAEAAPAGKGQPQQPPAKAAAKAETAKKGDAAKGESGELSVNAQAAILGDIDSGRILFEQNADEVRAPASLTKVMTLYLIYEALANGDIKLDDLATVSETAWKVGGSKTFVGVGDKVRVEDLVLGIAVQSGNDACVVMAEHLAGTEEGFAQLMNKKAKQLGMNDSHFVNASGLPDPNHVTTARDLFTLARALIKNYPQYSHFSREKQYTFNGILQYNRNTLLHKDPSVTGLKTGHTQEAGYCLIATNEKDGQRLSAVILGSQSPKVREEEALKLRRHGGRMYETVRFFDVGAKVGQLRVWKGDKEQVDATVREMVAVTVLRKERAGLEVGLTYQEPLTAPITAGQQIGTVVVKLAGQELLRKPVVAVQEVKEGGFFKRMSDAARLKFGL
ncbi:MAG: D-alanyl-D-alanine carboxypeptidase [Magnetococcales bacterium]|nr:D-alanyl-D-alanine carboxypeptidase [Magnetococcales bacterium]